MNRRSFFSSLALAPVIALMPKREPLIANHAELDHELREAWYRAQVDPNSQRLNEQYRLRALAKANA
jgi:hypothetical protein